MQNSVYFRLLNPPTISGTRVALIPPQMTASMPPSVKQFTIYLPNNKTSFEAVPRCQGIYYYHPLV